MMPIIEPAPAKLTLALHVRTRRPDGYHELETLFAFVRHGDVVTIEDAVAPSFAMTGPFTAALAREEDNLVLRAERAFRAAFDGLPSLAVTLEKNLPVASGIGGGSADAAAALRAFARRLGIAPDHPRLFEIADSLGSDVPACLLGRTAIGRGRGERLHPVAGGSGMPVLLVNPGVALSTTEVFAGWDRVDRGGMPQAAPIAAALAGRNDLESPARALAPVIGDLLERLDAAAGRMVARMSGSGATCFALFENARDRALAAEAIAAAEPDWWRLETELA